MMSERVMMNVFSVLKSRTSTAGFSGVIIVDSNSTGVEAWLRRPPSSTRWR